MAKKNKLDSKKSRVRKDKPKSNMNRKKEIDEDVLVDENPQEEATEKVKENLREERDYEAIIKDLNDKYLRLAAEFENYKKRTAREFAELVKSANKELLLELLPTIDHFALALEAEANHNNPDALKKGLELIEKDMREFLSKMAVEEIETVGKEFDPSIHEAVMQVPNDEYEEGIIIGETQKGYMLGGKILRPAKVIISSGPPSEISDGK